jgi:hypothetical protein
VRSGGAVTIGSATQKPTSKCDLLFGGLVAGLLTFGTTALMPAAAAERTGINLGNTSFFDGFADVEPGCAYIQFLGHDAFNTVNGSNGNKAFDARLDINYAVPQVTCNSDYKFFGGTLGWNVILPVSEQSSSFFSTNGIGVGDFLTGPYIQFPPVMSNGRPVFSQGFEFDIITPTGKHDASVAINPGNDFWSINPFWKATWLPDSWEVSWRLHYIHNFDHLSTPNVAGPGGATVLRNGDGVWLNFTASRELFKDFYFGLNGYWLKQISGDTGQSGVNLAGTQQESLYIGPGFHYKIDPKNIVNFNVYLPVTDVNAPSGGYQVNLQYIHPLN